MSSRHPLVEKLRRLAAVEKRWIWIWSMSVLAVGGLILIGAVCLIDYSFRVESVLFRFLLSSVFWIGLLYLAAKLVWPVARMRKSEVEIARQLESVNPDLGCRVSLAADFLTSGFGSNGSERLRKTIISTADGQLSKRILHDQIEKSRPMRMLAFLAAATVLTATIAIVNPLEMGIAVRRAANPFQTNPWPTWNQLVFKDLPAAIAYGDSLNVTVDDDNHRLPDRVLLEIKDGQGVHVREMKRNVDQMEYRMKSVLRPMSLRVRGGDHQSPWKSISVVHPPDVDEMTVDVMPPAYSGLPLVTIPIYQEVWAGSMVQISGNATKQFESAWLFELGSASEAGDPAPEIGEQWERWPLEIKNQVFAFTGLKDVPLMQNLKYRIQLVDKGGMKGATQRIFRVPVRRDEPPTVSTTLNSQRPVYAADSRVELEIRASDDMRLAQMNCEIRLNKTVVKRLSFRPDDSESLLAHQGYRHEENWRILLDFSELTALQPGDEIHILATASDIKGSKTNGDSLFMKIGSRSDLEELKRQQQSRIYQKLSSALRMQNKANHLTSLTLKDFPRDSDGLSTQQIAKATDHQRSVEEAIFSPGGVVRLCKLQMDQGLKEFTNGVSLPKIIEELLGIKTSVRRSTDLLNEFNSRRLPGERTNIRLVKAVLEQEKILSVLGKLVVRADEETKYQEFLGELKSILRKEESVLANVIELQRQSLGTSQSPTIENALYQVAVTQRRIADRLSEYSWAQSQTAKELESEKLKELAVDTKRVYLSAKFAAALLQEKQLGSAVETLQKLISDLARMLKFSDKRTNAEDRNVDSADLQRARRDFDRLRENQRELMERIGRWNSLSMDQRRQIREELSAYQDELERFAEEYGSTLSANAEELLEESRNLFRDLTADLERGMDQSANAKMEEIDSNFGEISSDLAALASELVRQIRTENYRQILADFKKWLVMEKQIRTDLEDRLNGLAEATNLLSELADRQRVLQKEFKTGLQQSEGFHAFQLQLKVMIKLSGQFIAQLLEGSAIQNDTRRELEEGKAALALLDRLMIVLSSLTMEEVGGDPAESPEGTESIESKQQPTTKHGVQISPIELQLLRLVQEEILAETQTLQLLNSKTTLAPEKARVQNRILQLADRQSDLIATVQKYLQEEDSGHSPKVPMKPPRVEIPPIEIIPDIPEIDCQGRQDQPSAKSKLQVDNPQHDTADRQRLAKQGEDLGEESDLARNRLEAVKERMMKVQEMMIQRKLLEENQILQKEIIQQLSSFAADQQKKTSQSDPAQKENRSGQQGNDAAAGSQTKRENGGKMRDSEMDGQKVNREIKKRIDRIWGHLPDRFPRDRRDIRTEDFLPKYRELIREYFIKLAKEPIDR
ncbi:hypothetical protein OAG56_02580 [Mariniblastus sp.]|nr:hypothetical protein [Mariniblastus sp.]MDB4756233.1 hypothetical protein [Mariniblastus sp.]